MRRALHPFVPNLVCALSRHCPPTPATCVFGFAQIKFLSFLHAGQLRLAKRIGVTAMGDSAEDFYQVLDRARREGASAASVFGT